MACLAGVSGGVREWERVVHAYKNAGPPALLDSRRLVTSRSSTTPIQSDTLSYRGVFVGVPPPLSSIAFTSILYILDDLFYLDYFSPSRVTNIAAWSVLKLLEAPPAHRRFGAVASNAKILPRGEDLLREPTIPEDVEADGGLALWRLGSCALGGVTAV